MYASTKQTCESNTYYGRYNHEALIHQRTLIHLHYLWWRSISEEPVLRFPFTYLLHARHGQLNNVQYESGAQAFVVEFHFAGESI